MPRSGTVLPLHTQLPTFGGLPQVLPTLDCYIMISVLDSRIVSPMVDNGIHDDVLFTLEIALSPHILRNDVGCILGDFTVRKLDFVSSCVKNRIVVPRADQFTISVTLAANDLAGESLVPFSYCELLLKVTVI